MQKNKSRKINFPQKVLEKPTEEDLNYIWNTGALKKKTKDTPREWYYDTSGVAGTILSAVFSLAFLGIGIFMLDYFAREMASAALAGTREFLLANVDVFFLMFLLTSFIKYCSKGRQRMHIAISPLAAALGITVFFWAAANIALIANAGAGNIVLSTIADSVRSNLLAIFVIFSILGYIVVLSKRIFEGIPGYMRGGNVAPYIQEHKQGEPDRIYHSKQN